MKNEKSLINRLKDFELEIIHNVEEKKAEIDFIRDALDFYPQEEVDEYIAYKKMLDYFYSPFPEIKDYKKNDKQKKKTKA